MIKHPQVCGFNKIIVLVQIKSEPLQSHIVETCQLWGGPVRAKEKEQMSILLQFVPLLSDCVCSQRQYHLSPCSSSSADHVDHLLYLFSPEVTCEILYLWSRPFRINATESRCVVSRSGRILQRVCSEDYIVKNGLKMSLCFGLQHFTNRFRLDLVCVLML